MSSESDLDKMLSYYRATVPLHVVEFAMSAPDFRRKFLELLVYEVYMLKEGMASLKEQGIDMSIGFTDDPEPPKGA